MQACRAPNRIDSRNCGHSSLSLSFQDARCVEPASEPARSVEQSSCEPVRSCVSECCDKALAQVLNAACAFTYTTPHDEEVMCRKPHDEIISGRMPAATASDLWEEQHQFFRPVAVFLLAVSPCTRRGRNPSILHRNARCMPLGWRGWAPSALDGACGAGAVAISALSLRPLVLLFLGHCGWTLCVCVCVCVCARACVRECVRACVRACVQRCCLVTE